MDVPLIDSIEALVEHQGTEKYVALVLDELGLDFVDDVPVQLAAYFTARCVALFEEDL